MVPLLAYGQGEQSQKQCCTQGGGVLLNITAIHGRISSQQGRRGKMVIQKLGALLVQHSVPSGSGLTEGRAGVGKGGPLEVDKESI